MIRFAAAACIFMFLLVPAAIAADLSGTYGVNGTNPDGTRYTGTAKIVMKPGRCRVNWVHGNNTSYGTCKLSGKTFSVDFVLNGSRGTVVYELRSNGNLAGVWWMRGMKSRKGRETLFLKQATSPSV
ncbi:MAG: hypothetical protein HC869_14935 [Rhodospirillales bacterium]|nr:hypothetical protein [Rhodospirillales bacterium]